MFCVAQAAYTVVVVEVKVSVLVVVEVDDDVARLVLVDV